MILCMCLKIAGNLHICIPVFSIDALDKEGLRDLGVRAYGHILGILKYAKKEVAKKRREELLVSFYPAYISWHA